MPIKQETIQTIFITIVTAHQLTIASDIELFCASYVLKRSTESRKRDRGADETQMCCKEAEVEAQQVSGGASLVSQIQKKVRRHHQQVREKTPARCSTASDMVKNMVKEEEEDEIQILIMW